MEAWDAKRLHELEAENNRLKNLLAQTLQGNEAMKVASGVKRYCTDEATRGSNDVGNGFDQRATSPYPDGHVAR